MDVGQYHPVTATMKYSGLSSQLILWSRFFLSLSATSLSLFLSWNVWNKDKNWWAYAVRLKICPPFFVCTYKKNIFYLESTGTCRAKWRYLYPMESAGTGYVKSNNISLLDFMCWNYTHISKLPNWNYTECPVKFPGHQQVHLDDGIVKYFHFVLGQTWCISNSSIFRCC